MAAKTPAPSGVDNAHQREMPILCAILARTVSRYAHKMSASATIAAAVNPPPLSDHHNPSRGQAGRNNAAMTAFFLCKFRGHSP